MSGAPQPLSAVLRRRVSLMGRRLDAADRPVSGGVVTATATSRKGDGREPAPVSAQILRPNGLYGFLDLPSGEHRIEGVSGAGAPFAAQTAKIAGDAKDRDRPVVHVDLIVKEAAPDKQTKAAPKGKTTGGDQ